jgi:hypothetical protein
MTFGLTSTGFNKKNWQDIKEDIQDDLRDDISPKLNFLDSSRFGQLIGVFGDKLRELWDVSQAVYNSRHPDFASGEALDNVASITGAIRLAATKSTATIDRLNLDAGVTVPVGSIVSVGAGGDQFVTTAAVTNGTGLKGTFSTTVEAGTAGEVPGYAGTIDTIVTPIVGWSAAVGVTGTNSETFSLNGVAFKMSVDGGAIQTVTFVGADPMSAATAASEIQAGITGVTAEDIGGKVRITSNLEGEGSSLQFESTGSPATSVLGFTADTLIKGFNSSDANIGTELETDPEFRLRRVELLRQTGKATVEAIRASLRAVTNVVQALVVENVELTTSPAGLPGKSFESIVQGGTDAAVAASIWDTKPAGIETYGTTTVVVTDSMGFTHDIKFARPVDVPIHVALTVTTDPTLYPLDGDDQVAQAIVTQGATLNVGDDVIALVYKCAPLTVTGVLDVTIFKIDIVDPPVLTGNIVIAFDELASFDTADIDVTSV